MTPPRLKMECVDSIEAITLTLDNISHTHTYDDSPHLKMEHLGSIEATTFRFDLLKKHCFAWCCSIWCPVDASNKRHCHNSFRAISTCTTLKTVVVFIYGVTIRTHHTVNQIIFLLWQWTMNRLQCYWKQILHGITPKGMSKSYNSIS